MAQGVSCTHQALFDFQLYWMNSNDAGYSYGTNAEATVTTSAYSGHTLATCTTLSSQLQSVPYYIVTDSTNTATGKVVTLNDVDGVYGDPCGYLVSILAVGATGVSITFELDSNAAIQKIVSVAGLLASMALFM